VGQYGGAGRTVKQCENCDLSATAFLASPLPQLCWSQMRYRNGIGQMVSNCLFQIFAVQPKNPMNCREQTTERYPHVIIARSFGLS
jgi:hypothetical protein